MIVAEHPILIRGTVIAFPTLVSHYLLIWVFTSMLNITFRFKTCLALMLLAFPPLVILKYFEVSEQWYLFPGVMIQSSLYFYASYMAFKHHRSEMSFSLKAIAVLFIVYGVHLFTYPVFILDLRLLGIGFAVAIAIIMGIAILYPAAIIEILTLENTHLKTEMGLKEKLLHSSKMAALGEMAGGVAHEINNPLMALNLSLWKVKKLILNNEKEQLTDLIENMQSVVERMGSIVKSLLLFSREDKLDHFQIVSVKEIIDHAFMLCSEKLKIHGVDLQINSFDNTIYVEAEKTLICQVLLNLINNSFDAILPLQEKWIKLEVKDLGDEVEISVTDSGKILDESVKEKMFEPFFSTKEVGQGSGIGLSISKGLVEAHSGKIMLDPVSTHTRIYFRLPKFMQES
jgi:signal transduction histidine kinase